MGGAGGPIRTQRREGAGRAATLVSQVLDSEGAEPRRRDLQVPTWLFQAKAGPESAPVMSVSGSIHTVRSAKMRLGAENRELGAEAAWVRTGALASYLVSLCLGFLISTEGLTVPM